MNNKVYAMSFVDQKQKFCSIFLNVAVFVKKLYKLFISIVFYILNIPKIYDYSSRRIIISFFDWNNNLRVKI